MIIFYVYIRDIILNFRKLSHVSYLVMYKLVAPHGRIKKNPPNYMGWLLYVLLINGRLCKSHLLQHLNKHGLIKVILEIIDVVKQDTKVWA